MHNLELNVMNYFARMQVIFKDVVDSNANFRSYRRRPKASDLLIICLKMAAESMGISSENNLYHRIEADYPALRHILPDRSNFNRRCKSLSHYMDACAEKMAEWMAPNEKVLLIDSTPLPICRNARIPRIRIMRDDPEMLPDRGWSACDRGYFFGYKLHLLTTANGLIISYFITPGNIHDSELTMDLCHNAPDTDIYGDKGYINRYKQLYLFENFNTQLITPPKRNSKQPDRKWNKPMGIKRKRIETVFSQFTDQFGIKRNYAKTFQGYYSRIVAKIAAMTFLQFVNYSDGNPIGQIKNLCVN